MTLHGSLKPLVLHSLHEPNNVVEAMPQRWTTVWQDVLEEKDSALGSRRSLPAPWAGRARRRRGVLCRQNVAEVEFDEEEGTQDWCVRVEHVLDVDSIHEVYWACSKKQGMSD